MIKHQFVLSCKCKTGDSASSCAQTRMTEYWRFQRDYSCGGNTYKSSSQESWYKKKIWQDRNKSI